MSASLKAKSKISKFSWTCESWLALGVAPCRAVDSTEAGLCSRLAVRVSELGQAVFSSRSRPRKWVELIRLVGAILLEQNDEWAVQRARYMTLQTIAPLSEDPIVKLPAVAA
jgi:hypothetical protein